MTLSALVTVILFGVVGGYFLLRLITDRTVVDRAFSASHLLMAVAMIMMPLGWSAQIPASLQLIVFTACALWFAYRARFHHHGTDHHHRRKLIYHAAMMLAMAWMVVIMAPTAGATAGHQHSAGPTTSPPSHPWAEPISICIGIGFAAAAIWYLARFIRLAGTPAGTVPADRRVLAESAVSTAMAAGMAVAFSWEMS